MPRIVCSAATTGANGQSGNMAAICAVSRSPLRRGGLNGLNGLHAVLDHEVMHCLLEFEPGEP